MRRNLVAVALALSVAALGAAAALGLPGNLDPSFGDGGLLVSDVSASPDDRAVDVLVQADGRIVAVGLAQGRPEELVAARYLENGALDPTFGGDGTVALDVEPMGVAIASSAALQADGRILVAASTGTGDFLVARLVPDGSLDPSFDGDGVVRTDFGAPFGFSLDAAAGIAVQPDGKIVVAGRASLPVGDPWSSGFAVARYDAQGALDPSFDGDGRLVARVGPNAGATDVAVHPDGRIVVAGTAGVAGPDRRFVVKLYQGNGADVGGALVDLAGTDEATALAVQHDGKIVVAGRSNDDVALLRLLDTGAVDTGFGGDGSVLTTIAPGIAATALDVVAQESGRIVAAGATTTPGAQDFALVRYLADGTLDTAFGADGIVTTDFGGGTFDRLGGVGLALDGDIVAAGWTGAGCAPPACSFAFGLARYESDPPELEVEVDVKPGTAASPVSPDRGTIPVAILSNDAFDATTVDAATVCFGDAGSASERDCTEQHGRGHVEDANGDGRSDVVLHFEAVETGIDAGDDSACLTGRTESGNRIRGCDGIRTN